MARFAHPLVRASLLGTCGGIVVLAVLLLWRGTTQDALILTVEEASNPHLITVWVGGAVTTPGLQTLERGSRVADAVDLAGGLKGDADTSQINMAAALTDAQHIEIPQRSRVSNAGTAPNAPAAAQDLVAGGNQQPAPAGAAPSSGLSGGGLVNINTATAADLEALPEIGPALAQRIIDTRTANGAFTSVDQLEAIRGISMRMVEILRPLVTVGP